MSESSPAARAFVVAVALFVAALLIGAGTVAWSVNKARQTHEADRQTRAFVEANKRTLRIQCEEINRLRAVVLKLVQQGTVAPVAPPGADRALVQAYADAAVRARQLGESIPDLQPEDCNARPPG